MSQLSKVSFLGFKTFYTFITTRHNDYQRIVYAVRRVSISDKEFIIFVFSPQILGLEEEIERRTLTYSRWKVYDEERDRKGWHPVTFNYPDATLPAIKEIQVFSVFLRSFSSFVIVFKQELLRCPGTVMSNKFSRG